MYFFHTFFHFWWICSVFFLVCMLCIHNMNKDDWRWKEIKKTKNEKNERNEVSFFCIEFFFFKFFFRCLCFWEETMNELTWIELLTIQLKFLRILFFFFFIFLNSFILLFVVLFHSNYLVFTNSFELILLFRHSCREGKKSRISILFILQKKTGKRNKELCYKIYWFMSKLLWITHSCCCYSPSSNHFGTN